MSDALTGGDCLAQFERTRYGAILRNGGALRVTCLEQPGIRALAPNAKAHGLKAALQKAHGTDLPAEGVTAPGGQTGGIV